MANAPDSSDELAPRGDPRRLRDEDDIDRMAREGGKSEWQERSSPAAGDPVSDDEKRGLNLLQNDPRGDGSIAGVTDAGEGSVGGVPPLVAPADGRRTNPPLDEGPTDGSTLT